MIEQDRTAVCGPKWRPNAAREGQRAEYTMSLVVLGGRQIDVRRPRAGEFCQYLWCPRAQDTGFCTPFNQECVSAAVAPVCGCDGVTYKNDCERIRAGVSPAHRGPC
jgi:hypothetical protein